MGVCLPKDFRLEVDFLFLEEPALPKLGAGDLE